MTPEIAGQVSSHPGTIVLDKPLNVQTDREEDTPSKTSSEVTRRIRMRGHRGGVTALACEQGGWLASCGCDGKVIVWDSEGVFQARLEGHEGWVVSAAWGLGTLRLLATGSHDWRIRVWELDGEPDEWVPGPVLEGHQGTVTALAWSGPLLVSGGGDGAVIVWDVVRGRPAHVVSAHNEPIMSLVVEDDRVFSGGKDGGVVGIDITNGTVIWAGSHTNWVRAVDVSVSQGLVFSGSYDRMLGVWRVSDGVQVGKLTGAHGSINAVLISPLTHFVVGGISSGQLVVWRYTPESGGRMVSSKASAHKDEVVSLVWVDEPSRVFASSSLDGTVQVWHLGDAGVLARWNTLVKHSGWAYSLINVNSHLVASGSWTGEVVLLTTPSHPHQ